jgi:hypothetical protein
MIRTLGPKNNGSLSLAVIACITALGIGTFYVAQSSKQTQQAISEAMSERASELGQNSNLSNLALLRSLLSEARTPDGAKHEPALFPANYFSQSAWDLQKNSVFQLNNVDALNNLVTVRSFEPGESSMEAATSIFNQTMSQLNTFKDTQVLKIVSLNTHPSYPFYISSVDVRAERSVAVQNPNSRTKNVVTYGRINLPAPVPQEMRVRIKPESESSFSDNFGTSERPLAPGRYVIQVIGKGVVHHGEIYANGKKMIVGLDTQGNIAHAANNIRAEAIIGQTEAFDLTGGEGVDSEHVRQQGCSLGVENELSAGQAPGSINIVAKLIGVDGTEANRITTIKPIIVGKVSSGLAARGAPVCQNSCPATAANEIYSSDASFANNLDLALTPGRHGNDTFESEKTGEVNSKRGRGIVCSNYELTAQAIKNRMGMNPSRARLENPTLYASVLHEALSLKQYVSYMAPGCQREVVGLRDGCGCFEEKTKIAMADGSEKLASEIRAGDMVWNPKTQKAQMIKKVIAGPEQWPLLEVKSAGKSVIVTGEHPFLTKDGLKPAFQLSANDVLVEGSDEIPVESVTPQKRAAGDAVPEVWNFELLGSSENEDHYVLANGVMTGDLYLQQKLGGKAQGRQIVSE